MKMHIVESRFVIGPSNILFGDVYECTFQPGNCTVKRLKGKEKKKEKKKEEKKRRRRRRSYDSYTGQGL